MHAMSSLALVWVAVLIANVLARYTRLTPVLWFLFCGAFMVNTGMLPTHADPFIVGLSELGIIIIMFAIGFEEDTSDFVDSIKKSWGIAFFGALFPFLAAYAVADYFWHSTPISMMCGLTMTATAVSLTMVSLASENLGSSTAATRIMTSALLDDIGSLALVAILVPIATGHGDISLSGLGLIAIKAILFFVVITVLGVWIFPHSPAGWISRVPFLNRYGIRNILKFGGGQITTLAVLLLPVLIGLLAHAFGFHPAVGAFMAGLILKQEYFHFEEGDNLYFRRTERIVGSAAYGWLGPIFFVHLGSQILLDWNVLVAVIPHVVIMTTAIFVSQIASASIAARYTGSMNWYGAIMVGFGMLGRAELAFVVMDIAYVQNAILPTEAFYTLMISAFFLNIAVPITIRLWKPRYCAAMVEAHEDPELTSSGNLSHKHGTGKNHDSRPSV